MTEAENQGFPGMDFDRNPDAAALAAIHGRAFAAGGAWDAGSLQGLLNDPLVRALKLGPAFGLIRILPDEAELLTLATEPAAQGQGLAGRLLLALHDLARAEGAGRMVLEVAEDNAPARALYNRLGYHQIGHRPAYYRRSGGNVAALVLSCPLA